MFHPISSSSRNGPVVLVSKEIEYTFPLSYAYLAGYLREMGEDVRLLFRPPLSQSDGFVKQIMDMKPVLVGFGSLYQYCPPNSPLDEMARRSASGILAWALPHMKRSPGLYSSEKRRWE